MAMFDKFVTEVLGKVWDFEPPKKIRRMKWHEAMLKYGSDKPDLRFDLEQVRIRRVQELRCRRWQDPRYRRQGLRGLHPQAD